MNDEVETAHNNVNLIYTYTEKEIDGFNKSIDNLATKLTATLGFSGVLLKFVSDIPNDASHFMARLSLSLLLFFTVGCCAAGLFARDGGATIRARALLKPEYYRETDEVFRVKIIKQWHLHIESLETLLFFRRRYLNLAIGTLVLVAAIFAGMTISLSIH